VNGVVSPLTGSQSFEVVAEGPSSREDRVALSAFQEKVNKLQQAVTATNGSVTEARTRLEAIRRAIDSTLTLPAKLHEQTLALEKNLAEIDVALNGDRIWRSHNEGVAASISEHAQAAAAPTRGTTGRPTKTALEQYQIASDELAAEIPKLRKLMDTDIKALEKQLDAAGAPPTPGRLPDWKGGK
jgi:chromosome segregation ATPase